MIPVVLGALILVGVGGTAYALTRERRLSAGSSEGRTSRFTGMLKTGKPYRVWARVSTGFAARIKGNLPQGMTPQAALTAAVKDEITRMGFSPVMLVTNDPTDNAVWTILGRWSLRSSEAFDSPDVRLFQLQETEEPPPEVLAPRIQGTGESCLDVGLTDEEAFAVRYALAHDEDPKHLGGLGSTFDPDYPIAANLLYAKAALANAEAYGPGRNAAPYKAYVMVRSLANGTKSLGPDVQKMWARYAALSLSKEHADKLLRILAALNHHVRERGKRVPPPITSAALQLALATRRPELSGVTSQGAVNERVKFIGRLSKSGHPHAREAALRLERANKLLERRNWIDSYKRDEAALNRGFSGPHAPGSLTRRRHSS